MKKLSEFQRALVDSTLEAFADVPREDEVSITPSPEFEAQADILIRKTKRTGWYYVNTALKRAILIAAIIGALATTALAVPAIRESIIDFFIRDEGDHYEFTFDPVEAATAPELIEQVYGPTYIPDGYELVVEDVSFGGAGLWWATSENQWICLNQSRIPDDPNDGDWLKIDAEDVTRRTITIGEYRVLMHKSHGSDHYFLFWTDNSYFYQLELADSISEEEMIKIFNSIQYLPQYDEYLGE